MKFGVVVLTGLSLTVPVYGRTLVQVGKGDVTSVQAIIRVTTDQAGYCTYRVSEGSSFNALVNDVNPALFTGSDSDSRRGAIVSRTDPADPANRSLPEGWQHIFVAGTRTSMRARDGKFYSRALQANTLHWVGVTCGTDAEASASFMTLNPPLGNSGPEVMPFDTDAFGNVAVPSINWADRTAGYNDPSTGTLLHRMTDPGDVGFYAPANTFTYAIGGAGWQNPSNALSAGSSILATCDAASSCNPSSKLALIAVIPTSTTGYSVNGAWDPHVSFTDFLVRIWGSGTGTLASDRTIAVCWSIDDQTCLTSSQQIVLPKAAAFAGTIPESWSLQSPWSHLASLSLSSIVVVNRTATVKFSASPGLSVGQQICINGVRDQSVSTAHGGNGLNGCHTIIGSGTNSVSFATNAMPGIYTDSELLASPDFPRPLWASWGVPPMHNLVGLHTGGVVSATSGSLVLSPGGTASVFDPAWPSGTKIFISGSSSVCANNLCTVSTVIDGLHLTLVEDLTISDANWTSANFSLLINKTTSSGAVSVSAAFDFVYSDNYNSGLDGSGDICNSSYVTIRVDANGNSIAPVQGYLCVATGSFGIFTPIYAFIPSTRETRLIARGYQPSVRDYRGWVGWHPTNGNCWFTNYPGQSVFQACYNGDYRALTPGYPQSTTEANTPEQVAFTDIFGGTGNQMDTQIANCAVNRKCRRSINSTLFAPLPSPPQTGAAVQGNYLLMCGGVLGGTQDSPGYITLWDIRSIPATLAWAAHTFDQFPIGYGGIHACIRSGTGQFNIASLNGSFGQLRGPLAGPWQQTPTQYNRGTGFTTNTAVAQTDGFECPSGLSAPWQALGAKPVAQGGVARCLEFIVPGDFCSVHSSPAESAAFPCPWNSASNYSLIKPIAEGDEIADARIGAVSYGEKMLVVKVTRKSATNIDLLVFRYSQQSQTPNSGFTCGTYDASEWTHSNGWTMQAAPYHACYGSMYWIEALDSTQKYIVENPALIGTHSDFGPGANGFTYVAGATLEGYITRANQPMPAQIGGAPTNVIVANPTFGSANLPDNFLQSYPSKRQQSALTASSEMDWALDVRHYNPGAGNPAETPEGLFGNKVALVAGHKQTYLITMPQTPDPQRTGFIGWAGFHMLADASGPKSASSFGDATPWHYCFVLGEGECVSGSQAGQMYVSVPQDFSSSPCLTNSYAFNAPCISNNYPYGFWVTQFDTSKTGFHSRRLTGSFVAPGRQYNFTNAKATPDGLSAQVQAPWLEGQRTDLFWLKMPPFPAPNPNAGMAEKGTPVELKIFGVPGDSVRVAFGYAENGDPAALYCTSRAEVCYAPVSTDPGRRFAYASKASSYLPCSHSCVVPIPAVRGRIFYYQVERHNGANTTTGTIGATAVQ